MPSVDSEVVTTTKTSPGLQYLDGGVNHQIIAGMAGHRDGRPDTLAEG